MKVSSRAVRIVSCVACTAFAFGFLISCPGGGEPTDSAQSAILSLLGEEAGAGATTTSPDVPSAPGVSIPQGEPAPPGEPANAPDVTGFQVESFDFQDYGAGFRAKNIQFNLPVHSGTVVAIFIGGKDMVLLPDNTVVNSLFNLSFTTGQLSGGGTIPPFMADYFGDRKWRLLVVARNEFGSSSKELPAAHARVCAVAQAAPVTFGDCGSHCIEATADGGEIVLKARRVVAQTAFYLWLDLSTWLPPHALSPGPPPYEWLEEHDGGDGSTPIPAGGYMVSTRFQANTYDRMCLLVESWSFFENVTSEKRTSGFVLVP